jgi:hypothetical protein
MAKRFTMMTHTSTTVLKVTTSVVGTAIENQDYRSGVFHTIILANASSTPAAYLDASVDGGTNYKQYATLHPDFTTTANSVLTAVSNLPTYLKVRIPSLTTTSSMRLTVKAELFAK